MSKFSWQEKKKKIDEKKNGSSQSEISQTAHQGAPPPPSLSVSLPIPESHPSREYTAYTGFGQVYYRVPWLFLINRQENQSRVDYSIHLSFDSVCLSVFACMFTLVVCSSAAYRIQYVYIQWNKSV